MSRWTEENWCLRALDAPTVNAHCHMTAQHGGMEMTLPKFLVHSYLHWQFAPLISPTMQPDAFLRTVSCNSYFYGLAAALGHLYASDRAPLSAENWAEIEEALGAAYRKPEHIATSLQQNCHYRAMVLDCQNNPGYDNQLPTLYRPALRCDMFLRGYAGKERDENENSPYTYLGTQPPISFSDYLDAVAAAISRAASQGVVALKLAIAYERGLDFAISSRQQAERGWSRPDATMQEKKAFEDVMMFHICEIAGAVGLPVQFHTGTGCLEKTNALQLLPLIRAFPDTQFVLLHSSYPFLDDALSLLHTFPNVFVDVSWLPLLSPHRAVAALQELLDVGDTQRLTWGCDTELPEESFAAKLLFGRTLHRVLTERIETGISSPAAAETLLTQILYHNPKKLYRLSEL